MVSPTVDRRFGLVGNIPIKAPVTVLAAGNITLSGQQTIDGVAVLALNASGVPDRVLCTAQTDPTQNGIWDVSTGSWTRSKDADGNYDFGQGTTVLVNNGATYSGSYWKVTTAGPITIGTTLLAWARALASSISTLSFLQAGTGAVSRALQDKVREVEVNVTDFMTTTQIANVQAGVGNATTDRACIQAAFDALPSYGGTLVLPAGTLKLDATYLNFKNRGNFTIRGAGMGITLIDAANHVAAAAPNNGIIVTGNAGGAASLSNVTLRDFSIKGTNTSNTTHMIVFRGINNVKFENLELYNGYAEVVYCDGPYPASDGLIIRGCYFHDNYAQLSSCIDTNTTGVYNILVEGNRFERVSTGIFCLGRNIRIVNNTFIDVSSGMQVGESNFNTDPSVSSVVISNNAFTGLGRNLVPFGGYAFTTAIGIFVNSKAQTYTDSGADNGAIVANNAFKDTYADITTACIEVTGGALIDGNYASGLATNVSAAVRFIFVSFSSDVASFVGVNTTPVHVWCSNNVLERKPGATYDFPIGLHVLSSNNAYLYLSGNSIASKVGGTAASFTATANGFLSFVSFNGDRFFDACRLADLIGTDLNGGLPGIPLWGDNTTFVKTTVSDDTLWPAAAHNFTGVAAINATKGQFFWTNNGVAQNVTDITYDTAVPAGKEISIFFNDANTTVVHNAAKIVLNGSVNFVSTVGSVLTLICPQVRNSAWYEKCRSKP